jgi:phosphatidylglycerophosphate synthase
MGRYHARDVVRVPSLLSLSRLPLAAAFSYAVGRPRAAFALLVTAAATDVLDGWYARRFAQATPTGAVLDGVTDKVFVLTVAATLVSTGQLSPTQVLLLSTREIGELPLVAWMATSPRARQRRAEEPAANLAGKVATALQLTSVSVALFRGRHVEAWVALTAVAGTVAAVSYWMRALRAMPARPAP